MKKELTKAEEQIMHALWSIHKGFAKDIWEALKEPRPAYNTVLTVVRVLVQKKFITYTTYGKSNEYSPTLSKEDYSNQRLERIKKDYFNNSTTELLSFFMKNNKVDVKELEEIIKSIKDDKK